MSTTERSVTEPITDPSAVPGDAGAPELAVPALSLVVLIGAPDSGPPDSGPSAFGRRHFSRTELVTTASCRELVADDPDDPAVTPAAQELLHRLVGARLAAGRLTAVDAGAVRPADRRTLLDLAREHDVPAVAIVLDPDPADPADATDPEAPHPDLVERQRGRSRLHRGLAGLDREGLHAVHRLDTAAAIATATVRRTRMAHDLRHETGPFDVIGDVHGCRSELEQLLTRLGYALRHDDDGHAAGAHHPDGRRAVFVGDLVDRGPDTPGVLRLVMGMVADGDAFCVAGNHEAKLVRALRGRKVQVKYGLAESLAQLAEQPVEFRARAEAFMAGLAPHHVLDGGALVVSHAGLVERYHGRDSGRVRAFCLYGQTSGESDEFGLPVRYPWAEDYRGRATVLYGHTPTRQAEWVNGTMCLDTGCVFGGALTALRYPEREVVSVPAAAVHVRPARPLGAAAGARNRRELLDQADLLAPRQVQTARLGPVELREPQAAAALEWISRFGVDPRWLLHLPPTSAPVDAATGDTATGHGLLEHPDQAFAAYRADDVRTVSCQEEHPGTRVVLLVCRDLATAIARFGSPDGSTGAAWTRTGRPALAPAATEKLLGAVRAAAEGAGLFDELGTGWLLLDAVLRTGPADVLDPLRTGAAPVAAAAGAALPAALAVLARAAERGVDVADLRERTLTRAEGARGFTEAYRRIIPPTPGPDAGPDGFSLAPFQLLAAEHATFADRPHEWHLALADRLVAAYPQALHGTRRIELDTTDPDAVAAAGRWWAELTADGAPGMLVKPAENLVTGPDGLLPPVLRVRGREQLRLVHGPDYTDPDRLDRLRRERRVRHKRSLAQREYALGLEGLERVVRGEPLRRVHECVFAVLACESEPVDPRL